MKKNNGMSFLLQFFIFKNINFLLKSSCIFIFSFLFYYTFIPADFNYNLDAGVSGDFLNIAKAYQVVPPDIAHYIPGRIISGEYVVYSNWPPLFPLFLAQVLNFNDSAFLMQARIIMVIISALTILCFYLLLYFIFKSSLTALFGSLIYLFLPFNILYSSLIACDVFVPLFYIVIVQIYLFYLSRNNLTDHVSKIIILSSLIVFGTFLSWQVFFILPAILLFSLIKMKKLRWPEIIIAFIVTIFIAFWFYWIWIKGTRGDSSNSMFLQLFRRSFFGLFNPEMGISFLKRTIKFLLGLSPILIFLIFTVRKANFFPKETNINLANAIWILGLTLLFYFIVMPGMFGPHEFQFLLLFPFCVLLLLFYLRKEGILIMMKLRLMQYVILCMFFLYFFIPLIHSYGKDYGTFNEKAITYLNDHSVGNKYQYILIDKDLLVYTGRNSIYLNTFVVTSRTNLFWHPVSFKEQFDVYSLKKTDYLFTKLCKTVSPFLRNNFDSAGFFIITKNRIPIVAPRYIIKVNTKERGYIYYFNRGSCIYMDS